MHKNASSVRLKFSEPFKCFNFNLLQVQSCQDVGNNSYSRMSSRLVNVFFPSQKNLEKLDFLLFRDEPLAAGFCLQQAWGSVVRKEMPVMSAHTQT